MTFAAFCTEAYTTSAPTLVIIETSRKRAGIIQASLENTCLNSLALSRGGSSCGLMSLVARPAQMPPTGAVELVWRMQRDWHREAGNLLG